MSNTRLLPAAPLLAAMATAAPARIVGSDAQAWPRSNPSSVSIQPVNG